MIRVLDQYEQYMRQTRTRVVAYRTSRYWPGERDGFRAAIESRVHRNGSPEDHAPGSRRLPGRPRPEASATRLAPGDPVITAFLEAALQCRERGPDGLVPLTVGTDRLLVRPGERLLRLLAGTPQRARQAIAVTGSANSRHHISLPGVTGKQHGPQALAAAGPHSTFLPGSR